MTDEEAIEVLEKLKIASMFNAPPVITHKELEDAIDRATKALNNEIWMEKLHKTTDEECIQKAQSYFDLVKEG